LGHAEHLFIGGYLTIVKKCGLIKSLWMSPIFFSQYSFIYVPFFIIKSL
jgi:hypothetical protein